MKPRIYVLFVSNFDGNCKFIKTEHDSYERNMSLACHLGWMNKIFCTQKGDNYRIGGSTRVVYFLNSRSIKPEVEIWQTYSI